MFLLLLQQWDLVTLTQNYLLLFLHYLESSKLFRQLLFRLTEMKVQLLTSITQVLVLEVCTFRSLYVGQRWMIRFSCLIRKIDMIFKQLVLCKLFVPVPMERICCGCSLLYHRRLEENQSLVFCILVLSHVALRRLL